jgi:hypothetical protein
MYTQHTFGHGLTDNRSCIGFAHCENPLHDNLTLYRRLNPVSLVRVEEMVAGGRFERNQAYRHLITFRQKT